MWFSLKTRTVLALLLEIILGILCWLNASLTQVIFSIDYDELLGIIEGYIASFLSIESYSSIVVRSLLSQSEDLLEFRCLIFNFFNNIDISLVFSFFHVYRTNNCLAHLLTKDTLIFDNFQERIRNISLHVAHPISSILIIFIPFFLKKIALPKSSFFTFLSLSDSQVPIKLIFKKSNTN